jgi:hypothetical protein
MAQVIHSAGKHGTSDLKKDKARSRIDVCLGRPFKRDQQRCNLQSA